MENAAGKLVFLSPPDLTWGIIFLLVFALVIYASLWSTRHIDSAAKRATLLSLHIIAFILISLILLNPALRVESYKEEKKKLAVLVDGSWSMNLPENSDGKTRIDAARDFLDENIGFFSGLKQNFDIDYYTFDEALEPASSGTIYREDPEGGKTDFGKVIGALKDKKQKGELDDVIIISDGRNSGEDPESAIEEAKQAGLRINTIGTTGGEDSQDIWIDDIRSSEVSFLRYPYPVEVTVKSNSRGAVNVPVSLYEDDKLISIKEASVGSEGGKVEFEIEPVKLGRKIYTVSVPTLTDELITDNNQKSFYTYVIINKIRILHVAGSPSWDVRFLRKALKRNPNVDLVSFFILRDPSDLVFASENELSLIPFPVNEIFGSELGTFDIVIFQNFNFQPYGIFGFHLRSIRDYVMNDGGAFLIIGGNRSFESGNYGQTPISEILPVELDYTPRTLTESTNGESVNAKLTVAGKNHPIMKIIPDAEENEREWDSMPNLESLNTVQGLNRNAVPLLVSPDGEPILAVSRAKTGKVASFLSDSSWRWDFVRGSEGDVSQFYDKFWNRLFLWLVNDPELNGIRVETDKAVYGPGEKPEIKITVIDGEQTGEDLRPVIETPNGNTVEIEPEKTSDERYVSEVETAGFGRYKVEVNVEGNDTEYGDTESSGIEFMVAPPENEVRGPTADAGFLKSIAAETGGVYITSGGDPGNLDIDNERKRTVTGYETRELWDSPVFLALIMALLFSEWGLRRRWGLK